MQLKFAKVNATLETIRSQRNILNARLQAARIKSGVGSAKDNRKWRYAVVASLILIVIVLIGVFSPSLRMRNNKVIEESKPNDHSNQNATVSSPIHPENKAPANAVDAQSHKWPIDKRGDITIPLPARVRAMDIAVTQYSGQPAYSLFAVLDNDTVIQFYFRIGLNYVNQSGFSGVPVDVQSFAISPSATYLAFAASDKSIRFLKKAVEDSTNIEDLMVTRSL